MDLSNILKSLEEVSKKLKTSNNGLTKNENQAKSLVNMFKKAAQGAGFISSNLKQVLPASVTAKIDSFAERLNKGAKVSGDIFKLQEDYNKELKKSVALHDKLTDTQAKYDLYLKTAVGTEAKDAERLGAIYAEMNEARQKGDFVLAADKRHELDMAESQALKHSQDMFSLMKQYEEINDQVKYQDKLYKSINKEVNAAKKESKLLNVETAKWRDAIGRVESAIGRFTESLTSKLALGAVLLTVKAFHEIGQATMQANGYLKERLKLASANFRVSLQIGAATAKVAAAQKALIAGGQKELASDVRRVKTVVMLSSALGVAEDDAAQLAVQSALIGANFEDAADAVSVLVRKTQLTADEATKVAKAMAQTQRALGISSSNLGDVSSAVGTMEGALKKLGSSGDTATKLIQHFSTLKGLGDSIMFGGSSGIVSPSDFNDINKLQAMLQNTGKQLQNLTGGDPLMLNAIEPMIQRMGLTINDARALMDMSKPGQFEKIAKDVKTANDLRKKTSDLEERYREQMSAAGEQWRMLKDQGASLVKMALTPMLWALTGLAIGLNTVLGWISSIAQSIESSDSIVANSVKGLVTAAEVVASIIVGGLLVKATWGIGKAALMMSSNITGVGSGLLKLGGSIGSLAGRVVPAVGMISAAVGAAAIVYQGARMLKAKSQEKTATKNLAELEEATRKRYGIAKGVDPIAILRQNRLDAESRGESPTAPVYQQNILPSSPTLPVANVNSRARDSASMEAKLDQLAKEMRGVQACVTTGANQQVKVAEKGIRLDVMQDRLYRENESLRAKPATVYGLENYAT